MSATPDQNDAIVKLFNDFDVKETSHHLVISHLDLHICDDIQSKERGNNTFLKSYFCIPKIILGKVLIILISISVVCLSHKCIMSLYLWIYPELPNNN